MEETPVTIAELPTPAKDHMSFVVPLDYTTLARNGFAELYKSRRKIILDALSAPAPVSSENIRVLEAFVESCDELSLTPSYIQDVAIGLVIPPERIPLDGVKFEFISALIALLRDEAIHIAVCARSECYLEYTERLLSLQKVSYDRPSREPQSRHAQNSSVLQFSLISTVSEASYLAPADIVVALDSSYNPELEHLKRLHYQPAHSDRQTTVVRLVMKESTEHVLSSIPAKLDEGRRLQIQVATLIKRFELASQSITTLDNTLTTTQMLLTWLHDNGTTESWPVQALPVISEPELFHNEPDAIQALVTEQQQNPVAERSPPESKKRAFDSLAVESEPNKRQRSVPPEVVQSGQHGALAELLQDSTQVKTETLASYPQALGSPIRMEFKEEPVPVPEVEKEKKPPPPDRTELYRRYALRLRESLQVQSNRFAETQLRFEYLRIAQKRTRKELRKSQKLVETLTARRQRANDDMEKLRDEKRALAEELRVARAELAASTVPGVGELEKAHAEARAAQAEASRNSARVESINRDFDFMRSSYQEASSAAAEAASEIGELKSQVEVLTRKASEEALKLRERTDSLAVESLKAENDELKARLEEREEILAKKEDEIRTIFATARGGRGGMMTRATSVPRSPRPMSRAVSPLPGSSPLLGGQAQVQVPGQVPMHLSPLSKAPHTVHSG